MSCIYIHSERIKKKTVIFTDCLRKPVHTVLNSYKRKKRENLLIK